jgi:predicted nucleotidyltransferase
VNHGLSDETVERIRGVLAGHPRVEKALLYGSRAKGTHRPGSDIDLTLQGGALEHRDLAEIAAELDDLMMPYRIDLSLFADLSHPDLLDHIRRVGIVLYARDSSPQAAGSR